MNRLILASASPRRQELLENIGLDFEVIVSGADESKIDKTSIPAPMYVQELALLKASDVAKNEKKALIISADTIVYADGKILGKPKDKQDAAEMLKMLSGKCHSVFTGICVTRTKDMFSVCRSVETKVYFNELTDEKIEAYVKTGEPMDKAGAYGIQGKASVFVSRIEGDYLNVVGLPVCELCKVLEEEFDFDVLKEIENENKGV